MNKIFKKHKLDKLPELEESISRTNTILIHWKSIPYNSAVTYISSNITRLGYRVADCVADTNILLNIRSIGDKIILQRNIQNLNKDKYREFEYEYRAFTSSGEEIWISECSRILYKHGKIAYGETLLKDITKEKNLENCEIKPLTNKNEHVNDIEDYVLKWIWDKIVTLEDLQSFQDDLFTLSNCIGICINSNQEKLTELSGNKQAFKVITEALGVSVIQSLIRNVAIQIFEENKVLQFDTKIDTIKVIGKPIVFNKELNAVWILFVIAESQGHLGTLQANIVTDLLNRYSKVIQVAADYHIKYILESNRRSVAEYNIEEEKQRNEIFAYIIQLLDSDQDFEAILYTLLEVIGKYKKLNNAVLFKVGKSHNFDIVGEWKSENAISYADFSKDKITLNEASFHTNIIALSENEEAGIFTGLMKHSNAVSMLAIPIIINEEPAMLATFLDDKPGRKWDVDTISFFTDICRMLESIIYRRITKNSLVSSYAALKEILDNIGSIIYVFDKGSKKILFCNELFKRTCKQDMVGKYCWDFHYGQKMEDCEACSIKKDSNRFIEHYNPQTEKWSEIRYNDITWVDGNLVSLCIITDVTDMKKYQKKIEFQANNDFLTGLYNRMRCEQDLSILIQEAIESQKIGAVLFIDLDDFKHINDGLGHQYGDLLLKMVAIGLQQVRGLADKCYRVGGDEFLIIIPPDEFKNLDYILESIKKLFSKSWYLEDSEYYCTMSMGIVCFPKDGEDVSTLIKKADIAMYDAKNSGKNRYKFYNSGEEKYSYERLDIEKKMRIAISAYFKGFEIYLQPVIDTLTKECIGGEALLRWNCEQIGFIMPNEFIPIAEHIGLITHLGDFALRQACLVNKRWSDEGLNRKISVNLSVIQLLQSDIVESIEEILKETGVKPQNLILEVTENLAINDMSRMKKIIDRIKALGIGIALDDFGTGYSSLSYIKQMNLDIIKVDKSFVADITEDNYARAFVKLIAELSEQLNVKVCVEGVETQEQYNILQELNVSYVQGYYFDKPIPVKEFEKIYYNKE